MSPSLDQIRKFKKPPAESGELALVEFLARELDDTYEVFFQPMMDVDKPDIVILRQSSGVAIIEVKDWDLRSYDFREECLYLRSNRTKIRSPIRQVQQYKKDLINLYIPDLCAKTLVDPRLFGVVGTAVYFHCARESELRTFFHDHAEHTQLLGFDSLTTPGLAKALKALRLDQKSLLFDADLYQQFRRC
jgi:hypothetical protein